MKDYKHPGQLYCVVIGALLVVLGFFGFLYSSSFTVGTAVDRELVAGLLAVNGWHNALHALTGALLLVGARTAVGGHRYSFAFGVLYLALFLAGLAAGAGGAILGFLPVNAADNLLHAFLGLTGVAAGLLAYRYPLRGPLGTVPVDAPRPAPHPSAPQV